MIGNATIAPITEMNELNARAAINTYFVQRKAFLTGASEELPMANDPLEADEAKHLTKLNEAGLIVLDSTVIFGNIRCWDNYAEVNLTETMTFTQNGTTSQESIPHIILLRLDEQGNIVVESDGYKEASASFTSSCYVDLNAIDSLAYGVGGSQCIRYVAYGEIGTTETASGWTKYGAAYDAYYGTSSFATSAWCASFVFWCARNSGISNSVIPYYASCTSMKDWFSARGKFYKSSAQGGSTAPQAGDIIFLNGTLASPDHVGIIYSVGSSTITYVDGNNGNAVTLSHISRSAANIIGYGRPAYACTSHPTGYSSNATQHWLDCTACSYTGSKSAHSYVADGVGCYICSVCGYTSDTPN